MAVEGEKSGPVGVVLEEEPGGRAEGWVDSGILAGVSSEWQCVY